MVTHDGSRKKSSCEPVKITLQDLHFLFDDFLPPFTMSSLRLRKPTLVTLRVQTSFEGRVTSRGAPRESQYDAEPTESLELDWKIEVARVASDVPTSITFAFAKARCNSSALQAPTVPSKE